jgi:hypothetical protein
MSSARGRRVITARPRELRTGADGAKPHQTLVAPLTPGVAGRGPGRPRSGQLTLDQAKRPPARLVGRMQAPDL